MGMEIAATVAVAAALGGYQVYAGEQQRKEGNKERRRQQHEASQAKEELKTRQLNEQALEGSKARRLKSQAGGGQSYQGKGGTVLTSPQGVSSSGTVGGGDLKTVLGQ